jgi:hypothetical protein
MKGTGVEGSSSFKYPVLWSCPGPQVPGEEAAPLRTIWLSLQCECQVTLHEAEEYDRSHTSGNVDVGIDTGGRLAAKIDRLS